MKIIKTTILSAFVLASLNSNAERTVVDVQAKENHQQKVLETVNQAKQMYSSCKSLGSNEEVNSNCEEKSFPVRAQLTSSIDLPEAITEDDFFNFPQNKVELGKFLFFDKILSGNMNISCASCHHPMAGTGDGLALPVGEGGNGLGITRDTGYMEDAVHERVPRNAPHIFNLGAKHFDVMFHDGRVMEDASQPSGFISPAGDDLPMGLDNALAVQAMFPVTSATEMAGQEGENPVASATAVGNLAGTGGVWEILAGRIKGIDEYVDMFKDVYADVNSKEDITMVHIANAIGAFEGAVWRAFNSPFDQYLNGDEGAMSPNQIEGMNLFFGEAGCSSCHGGKFLTDNSFQSIGMPQIGPGKGDNLPGFNDGLDDFGRERETGSSEDRYRFRVQTARNALLTGPWGHAGAYNDLRQAVVHHLNPQEALNNYDETQNIMPYRRDLSSLDYAVMNDEYSRNALLSNLDIENVNLSEQQIDRIMDFLDAATDRNSIDLRNNFPMTVPSGLPVFD